MSLFAEVVSSPAGDGEGGVSDGTTMGHGVAAWYALRTRSRHEKRIEEQLRARGIDQDSSQVARWRQSKDRRKLVAFPLFPGYLFNRLRSPIAWRS